MKKSTIRRMSPQLEYTKHRHEPCLGSMEWFLTPWGDAAREREHVSPDFVAPGIFGSEMEGGKSEAWSAATGERACKD